MKVSDNSFLIFIKALLYIQAIQFKTEDVPAPYKSGTKVLVGIAHYIIFFFHINAAVKTFS